MTLSRLFKIFSVALPTIFMASCEDNVSTIGGSLVNGEVTITADTLVTNIDAQTIVENSFDARTQSKLLGRLNVPEYGSLNCSFVSELLSSTKMNIPDSITANDVDSMRMCLIVPRGSLTGDSLSPQQLKVYKLTKQLPSKIDNNFDPKGYYDSSNPMGVKSYTLSAIAKNDSMFKEAGNYINIPVNLGKDLAVKAFNMYRDPEQSKVFQWPSSFNKIFPGIYVEQNFGNGCVGLISSLYVYTYWHYTKQVYTKKEGTDDEYEYVPTIARDSICLFSSQPEVLSSNIITYKVSDYITNLVNEGKSIITTPGGYSVKFKFPVQDLIDRYLANLDKMSVVSLLNFEMPAEEVKNDYDISVAPYMLMVRSDKKDEFFNLNKVPDGKTSFYAEYNEDKKSYFFSGMRAYFLELLEKYRKGEKIEDSETEFTFVPVIVDTETVDGYNSSTTYVTRCAPYIGRPTITNLETEKAKIYFTFSRQVIE